MASHGANYRLFWQEFRRTFHSTGAVLPSGPRLCRALARFAKPDGSARRILEVGPGTGVVTDEIIRNMGPADILDVVELNDRFVAALEARLAQDEAWRRVAERVRIHHAPIEQLSAEQPFDVIISGLPLNNFAPEVVRSILNRLEAVAAPGATLSFFEYVAVRKLKALVCSPSERRRLAGVGQSLDEVCRGRRQRRDCILANIPPAWVHHLKF